MNLDILECFLHLSRTLNFTETAKTLGLTQPSVSRKIKALEEQVHAQLFIRDQHQVKLTSEGKRLRSEIAPLLKEIQTTLQATQDEADTVSGNLSFACYPEVGQYFFTPLLLAFQNQYPELDLKIHYMLDDDMQKGLREGNIHFAVMGDPFISESMRSYPILQERAVLVTRSQNKLKPAESGASQIFVAYNSGDQLLSSFLKKTMKTKELNKNKRLFTANSHKSILDIVLSQDCYAVLPIFSVEKLIQEKKIKIVSEYEVKNQLYLVHRESNHLSKRDTTFRKFITQRCKTADLSRKSSTRQQ